MGGCSVFPPPPPLPSQQQQPDSGTSRTEQSAKESDVAAKSPRVEPSGDVNEAQKEGPSLSQEPMWAMIGFPPFLALSLFRHSPKNRNRLAKTGNGRRCQTALPARGPATTLVQVDNRQAL